MVMYASRSVRPTEVSAGRELMCIRELQGVSMASREVASESASSGTTTAESPSISAMYGATNASDAEIATLMLSRLTPFGRLRVCR